MRVHLPKPLHGWREFVGEVGIIVLGVLIALGAEQVVEAVQWHKKAAVVRKSLMGELGYDRARWEVDAAEFPCALREIDQLDHWAEKTGSMPVPATRVLSNQVPFFWMHSANWNLATRSQTLDHFPVEEQLALSRLYDGIAHREVEIEKATDLAGRVQTLIPLVNHPERQDEMRAALGSLRLRIVSLKAEDAYMRRHFDTVDVKADRSDFASDFDIATCPA